MIRNQLFGITLQVYIVRFSTVFYRFGFCFVREIQVWIYNIFHYFGSKLSIHKPSISQLFSYQLDWNHTRF
jgi:hypothetical protein